MNRYFFFIFAGELGKQLYINVQLFINAHFTQSISNRHCRVYSIKPYVTMDVNKGVECLIILR